MLNLAPERTISYPRRRSARAQGRLCRWPKRFGQAHRLIESFNARLWDECLDKEVFDSPGVERRALAIWRHNDNNVPPQLAMGRHHARGRARVVQALWGSAPARAG